MSESTRIKGKEIGRSISIVALIAAFAFSVFSDSFAQRRGGGGGSAYRSSSSTSYRTYIPSAQSPRYTQSTRQLSPSSSYPRQIGGSRPSSSAPRALPRSIAPTSPVVRLPSFSGKVTKSGSPIIRTSSGKLFSVPQQGVMSSKMSLVAGVSRSAVIAKLGPRKIFDSKDRHSLLADYKYVGGLSAEQANFRHEINDSYPPYEEGTRARDIILERDRAFVRVFAEGKTFAEGRWVMRKSDITDLKTGKLLAPEQIRDRFSLESVPTHIVDVTVPAGTKVRVGRVGAQDKLKSKGGGTQYELFAGKISSKYYSRGTPL